MITGKKLERLTAEMVRSKVSSFDIYRYYIGVDFRIGKPFNSPFRKDTNPSFSIDLLDIGLSHVDYGDMRYRGGPIDFVMQYFGMNLKDALLKISQDFGLGFGSDEKYHIRKAPVYKQPKIEVKKDPPHFLVYTRKFTQEELKYWAQYHIDLEDLKAEHIYAPKTIYRNREKQPLKKTELVFCYYYPDIEKWKIYRPMAPKRLKTTPSWQWKWDTNIPFDHVEHLDKIKDVEYAYVAKSRKDRMVLKKALQTEAICTTHAEDPRCLTEETIATIKSGSQVQVVTSDNDKKGKQFSHYLTDTYGFVHCNVPDILFLTKGYTDFADWAKGTDLQTVYEHFKTKQLINEFLKTG